MQQRKKILVFLPFLTRGGAETQGLLLAKGLKQHGFEVLVCGFKLKQGEETLLQELEASQIAYTTLPFGMDVFAGRASMWAACWSFKGFLKAHQVNVIIPFTWWCNFLSAIVFRFAGVRQCFWNQRSVDTHVPIRKVEKLIPVSRLTFVSNSNPGKKFIAERFGIAKERVAIIHNGIKQQAHSNTNLLPQDIGIDSTDMVMVMVANFFPEKDASTVVRGVDLLRHKIPNIKMLFVGNADSYNGRDTKALAFDLQLCENIKFVNSIREIGAVLKMAHLGVLSSTSEGCPNSVLEYINYGLPVLATNIEAIADVTGKEYPFLFHVKDENDFAEKALMLLQSENLRQQTAAKLQQTVLPEFSTPKMIEQFLSLIV